MIHLTFGANDIETKQEDFQFENLTTLDAIKQYSARLSQEAKLMYQDLPIASAVKITVHIYNQIPKAIPVRQRNGMINGTIKPMFDGLLMQYFSCVSEALTNVIFSNVKQITNYSIEKFYSLTPHVEVLIEEL
ncbi:RusA family crossover junction endodeoxyribonuclease [Holzapfeliella sp. JNUCC 80]